MLLRGGFICYGLEAGHVAALSKRGRTAIDECECGEAVLSIGIE